MPFTQEQVAWLLANRGRISRYIFIPQLLAAAIFLSFAYGTGKVHARLLFRSARTQGTIVAVVPYRYSPRASSQSTIYAPLIEFRVNDRVFDVQEWKGSASRAGLGSLVPVIYDPADPSIAMMDRGLANWVPWVPCFAISLVLALASLKGLCVLLFVPARSPAIAGA